MFHADSIFMDIANPERPDLPHPHIGLGSDKVRQPGTGIAPFLFKQFLDFVPFQNSPSSRLAPCPENCVEIKVADYLVSLGTAEGNKAGIAGMIYGGPRQVLFSPEIDQKFLKQYLLIPGLVGH
jgi:hypothetical protein